MMNNVNDHDAAMSDVPSFIQFSPNDAVMYYGTDYEDEGCDINKKDIKEEVNQKQYKHQDNRYVSHQNLDAMKRMIQEIRRNPELMHQSPVYSKSILSLNDGPAPALQRRPYYPKNEKSQAASPRDEEFYALVSLTMDGMYGLVTPDTQKALPYCQECSGLSMSPPNQNKQTELTHLMISQFPPLPFR
mmetsp:Transcript_37480/g.69361  ORF Transcript_37480/g.69361 Transcript_37480/m.69361 type:complete len:188 (+) Transcript_37480:108-671(+)|eukprot:CAMPEP_0196130794 /NCGR_PEP_ID=MMETSP0910-20130528/1050_1 /TAXON_ID=49265 /ORGANISM="Thalassiosira rotula, Strain GSO102" /LENGTH=187 /DNA_ID=CAMNT_0041390167 /DNA_START=60 /DNA_END=623 /DNA_ORIENTATION=-